jgi:hypothetical protein
MNALGAVALATLILVVLVAPRRTALLGMMAGVLYLTQSQALTVFGVNMFAVRFLELAGFARVALRRELALTKFNQIDRMLFLLYGFTTIVYLLRASDGQAYVVGMAVDAYLCYFTFSRLIRDLDDLRWFLRSFALLLLPYAGLVAIEAITHHSLFSFLGEGKYDWTRNGRFRCVGSFRNPDLLGTLGSAFLPLYIGLACTRGSRKLACLGAGLCLLFVWASNSGGPICAAAVGCIGWALWPVRTRMRIVRWAITAGIALLALVMKAPVWYLPARASGLSGGDGWHRSYLMDVSFRHLHEWWLGGMPISETIDWFPYPINGGADITNQYVAFGLTAGVGAVLLFVLLLTRCFSALGNAMASVRLARHEQSDPECLLWGMCVVLVVHIVNWFGITYFDQTYVVWFMQLAAISTLSAAFTAAALPAAEEPALSSSAVPQSQ